MKLLYIRTSDSRGRSQNTYRKCINFFFDVDLVVVVVVGGGGGGGGDGVFL